MRNFKAGLFDLDGTILDSMWVWEEVDRIFLERRGLPNENLMNEIAKMNLFQAADFVIEKYNLKESPKDILREWHDLAQHEYENNIVLKPFAKEYLLKLKEKGVKLGVCTASGREFYEPVLKRNGVYSLFGVITTTEDAERGKGFPDIYLKAAEALGEKPEDCVVFEDILAGIRGAKLGNMTAVGVYDKGISHQEEKIREEADYYIKSFSELL